MFDQGFSSQNPTFRRFSRTPAKVREEPAVQAPEPGGVLSQRKAVNPDHVHLVPVPGVAEADLIGQVPGVAQVPLGLQVRVELGDHGQGRVQHVLREVAHGHVVR